MLECTSETEVLVDEECAMLRLCVCLCMFVYVSMSDGGGGGGKGAGERQRKIWSKMGGSEHSCCHVLSY